MKPEKTMIGRVVVSIQGHDKGRWYCVTAVDDQSCLLCSDGEYRQMDEPKKKKEKHLKAMPFRIDLEERGGSGAKLGNSDLRKRLKEMKLQYQSETEWKQDLSEKKLQEGEKEDCALVQK